MFGQHHLECRLNRLRAMIGACLLMWCLGQGVAPSERVMLMHDVHGGTERAFAYESPWVSAGFIEQTEEMRCSGASCLSS
jgi:hypothetical protein